MKLFRSLFSFFGVLLLLPSLALADSFHFALDSRNLSATQAQAAQTLLNQATTLLPTVLKERVGQAVPVHFVATQGSIAGMAHRNKKEINLSTNLLSNLVKNLPLDHSNLALATILHEATHLYDDAVNLSEDDLATLRRCNDLRSNAPGCQQLRASTVLSSQSAFRRVSGWYGNDYVFTFRENDSYEAKNPRETLAVNMEFFLLDPSYACRKPSLARYLAKQFQWQPFPPGSCQMPTSYVNSMAASPKQVLSQLPMDRVFEVDYLLAAKGSALESRFGHAMLRLVICPVGKALSEDCRKDISSHLVLSFRASVTDFHTSALKGMTGDYPSRLFILPLTEIIQEYASSELRDLYSYPLKLSPQEKQQFLERALEYHWNYQGKYYFLTNNCADETVNLLASSTLRPELLKLSVASPIALAKDLRRLNLLDDSALADQKVASEKGLFFASYQKRYDMAFAKIQTYAGQTYDMKTWQSLGTDQRYELFKKLLPLADAKQDHRALAAAFYLLETTLLRDTENVSLNWMAGQILDQQKKASMTQNQNIVQNANEYLFLNSQLVNPAAILVGQKGYGLPNSDELSATQTSFEQLAEQYQSTQKNLATSIKSLFPQDLATELEQIQAHLKIYLQTLTTQPITKGTKS